MSTYTSKSELKTSQALLQAYSELKSMILNAWEAIHKMASSYSSSRQFSLQEALYYSLPELWLRKLFSSIVFDNTGIPSERIRICKSVEEIQKLDPDTTNIFKRNMVGTYTDRPNIRYKAGMYDICFEIFVAHYYLGYENKDENDSQPDVFGDETKETPQGISETLPKSLTLMSFSEKLKLRKTIQVLKYHVPNKHPRNSTHYLLFMFYPF